MQHQNIVHELDVWIHSDGTRQRHFEEAVRSAVASGVKEVEDIRTLSNYLVFLDELLTWIPSDSVQGKEIFHRVARTYFIFNQPSVQGYQCPIAPSEERRPLTWLSDWIVRYGRAIGMFMDSTESITQESVQRFRDSPKYNLADYTEPEGGWRTFNEFFARKFKPGRRPVSNITNPNIICSPADWTYNGELKICLDSTVTIKTLAWKISELLSDSPYKDRFKGGQWISGYLGPYDYHRVHAPVGGVVVEARIIAGQQYVQIQAKEVSLQNQDARDGEQEMGSNGGTQKFLATSREFEAPNELGYQFSQSRALIILDTALGFVAVLPVGMAMVSSVKLTVKVGSTVLKGGELAYFQFGGSDVVVLFQASCNMETTALVDQHYRMGEKIGEALL